FVGGDCGAVIAGITSGGASDSCLSGDHSYDANVARYRTFIEEHGGADLQSPTCGSLAQVGDPTTMVTAVGASRAGPTDAKVHTSTVAAGDVELPVALNAIDDGASGFDLYLRRGAPPTTSAFDCKADGSGQFGTCVIPSPTAGTWYAMVRSA